MKIKYKIKTCLLAATMFMVGSCDDDVTVENRNEITIDTFFENAAQLASAANATYASLQTSGLYQRFGYILPDTFSDEMIPSGDPNFLPSYNFAITPTLDQTSLLWTQCFNGIARCNFLISNEDKIRVNAGLSTSGYTDRDVDNRLGEARFMRGLYYYFLVKRYGGVPLYPEELTSLEGGAPRSTEVEVYDFIIEDLEFAAANLFEKGSTPDGRATRGAALGMLGKVLLHREQYNDAKTALDQITGYSLLPMEEYQDNFNDAGEFNDESMFEVAFSADNNPDDTWMQNGQGIAEVTFHAQEYSGWANARPSQKMIDEFETDDPRRQDVILLDGESYGPNNEFTNGAGNIWYKFSQLYENENTKPEGETNARVLRYADVVLMQAEVANALGNDNDTEPGSLFYLNQLRDRVGLPRYGSAEMDSRGFPVGTSAQVFDAIVHERMVELCAEQQRFDDLVRWGLDVQELATDDNGASRAYNPGIHKFMPIPQSEIDTNEAINSEDQNPGY